MPTQAWVISSSKISKMTQNGGGGRIGGGGVAWLSQGWQCRAWPYQGHIMRGLENKQGPHMNLALACKHTWARRHKVWCGCNNTRHGCGIHTTWSSKLTHIWANKTTNGYGLREGLAPRHITSMWAKKGLGMHMSGLDRHTADWHSQAPN